MNNTYTKLITVIRTRVLPGGDPFDTRTARLYKNEFAKTARVCAKGASPVAGQRTLHDRVRAPKPAPRKREGCPPKQRRPRESALSPAKTQKRTIDTWKKHGRRENEEWPAGIERENRRHYRSTEAPDSRWGRSGSIRRALGDLGLWLVRGGAGVDGGVGASAVMSRPSSRPEASARTAVTGQYSGRPRGPPAPDCPPTAPPPPWGACACARAPNTPWPPLGPSAPPAPGPLSLWTLVRNARLLGQTKGDISPFSDSTLFASNLFSFFNTKKWFFF